MRRFAYWLFPLTAAAVAVFIVVFMIRINSYVPSSEDSLKDEYSSSTAPIAAQESWISRFSMSEEKGYFYPINEVHLELDMGENAPVTRHRLAVPLKDSYELFCLKQELMNSGLPYFLHKEGDVMTLLVDSDDQNKLESLVTKLKTYQISATVSPYTEEK